MTGQTAAERIAELKAERDRAIMWAVEMEGRSAAMERLLIAIGVGGLDPEAGP